MDLLGRDLQTGQPTPGEDEIAYSPERWQKVFVAAYCQVEREASPDAARTLAASVYDNLRYLSPGEAAVMMAHFQQGTSPLDR